MTTFPVITIKNISFRDLLLTDHTYLPPGDQRDGVLVQSFELEWLKRGRAIEVGAPLDKWIDPRYLDMGGLSGSNVSIVDEDGSTLALKIVRVTVDAGGELADIEVADA